MWTKNALQELVQIKLSGQPLVLVANREPYQHRFVRGEIECIPPASGMVSALEPIMRACGGTWIAHGSGSADRKTVDFRNLIRVPPDQPEYTLRRVWLTKEQEDGYYNGLSNEGLWPLCHMVFTRPAYHPPHWPVYREVNELFARAVQEELQGSAAFVFVQDYHFGLLSRILKESNPNLAYSLAGTACISDVPLERGIARWTSRERPARVSPSLPLPKFFGHC
jgi:trehalose 6-phosphate synthase